MRTRYEWGDGTIERARQLRRDMTPAEKAVWSIVRAKRLGLKFRAQQRLGPFYGDFVCQAARLVVELDGDTHGPDHAIKYDADRSAFLERAGYRVLRFTNEDALTNLEGVATAILAALTPSPSQR